MAHFVDLHSHVLPGIDDGARDLEQSGHMLRLLAAVGFSEVCATPHQKAVQFLPSAAQIEAAYAAARTLGGPNLLLGAENFWDDVFFERAQRRAIPSYTGGKAFLVEIPPQLVPPRFEDSLFAERARGLLPVLAHPERYAELCADLDRMAQVGKTAALVVDLGALDGAHGWRESRAARKLVSEGLAHAVASDVHAPDDVQRAAAGIAWLRRKLGEAAVRRLLEDHPRRILQGELPE
ncbi:MAG TPA: CpsB/CapC family capsule biosynthesis tyrosine phosphatase [Polyangia bacterium]|nr:CpsB/CapC family capsule biosynthesis tyrosine phosphatase [Polyangia bacterium]